MINIIIEKIITGNTQTTHDVLGTSPEGLLNVLTSGIYMGSSGDSQGINTKIDFMKNCFSEVTVLVLHIYFCFLQ